MTRRQEWRQTKTHRWLEVECLKCHELRPLAYFRLKNRKTIGPCSICARKLARVGYQKCIHYRARQGWTAMIEREERPNAHAQ